MANPDGTVTVHPRNSSFDDWQWEAHYVTSINGQNLSSGIWVFKNLKLSNSTYSYFLSINAYSDSTGTHAYQNLKVFAFPAAGESTVLNGYIYNVYDNYKNSFYPCLWTQFSYAQIYDGVHVYNHISNWFLDSTKFINIESSFTNIYTSGDAGWWSGDWWYDWYSDDE